MTTESSKKKNDEELSIKILKNSKVFNDPIHGTVLLHPVLVSIIDTPQFQRLRYIKQLGGCYFVYPGASHNRYEHSIGVAHLAGLLVKALQTSQTELEISDEDVLCVQIAGLCHDMGHGPFSHLFETFIHKTGSEWKHEDASILMFDHMLEHNTGLKERMEEYKFDIKQNSNAIFIKEMIKGEPLKDPQHSPEGPQQSPEGPQQSPEGPQQSPEGPVFKGRSGPDKRFFYDIVANKRNGIDVDKFDYLARDAHHLGIKAGFDHLRFIHFARVCKVGEKQEICTRDKEVDNLYDLFHLRYLLHQRAYQHKVNKIIESMIVEAFEKADGHIKIEGSDKSLSEAIKDMEKINDMEAYTKLTDHVYEQILHSTDNELADAATNKKLAEARELLERIVSRQHYRFLGETKVSKTMKAKMKDMNEITPQDVKDMMAQIKSQRVEDMEANMMAEIKSQRVEDMMAQIKSQRVEDMKLGWKEELAEACRGDGLTADDFDVHIVKMDYGMKDKDPIEKMWFYSKSDLETSVQLTDDQVMFKPTYFSEQLIRAYWKKIDKTRLREVQECVSKLCREKKWPKEN